MAQHRRPDEEGWFRLADVFGILIVLVVSFGAYLAMSEPLVMDDAEIHFVSLVSSDGIVVEAREHDIVATGHAVCIASAVPRDELVLEVAVHLDLPVKDAEAFVDRAQDFCATLP